MERVGHCESVSVFSFGILLIFIYVFIIHSWNKPTFHKPKFHKPTFHKPTSHKPTYYQVPYHNQTFHQFRKCFQLVSQEVNFRSLVERLNKNRDCSLITHHTATGRVGNQMFQVAAVIGLAQRLDMIPVIKVKRLQIAKYFNFSNIIIGSNVRNSVTCNENGYATFSECSRSKGLFNLTIRGYRQSWKYFDHAKTDIRNVFTFKDFYMEKAITFIKNVSILDHDNVCVHVRRGDLLLPKKIAFGYTTADNNFYRKAMQFYLRKLKRVRFIVLSDDMEWCRHNIKDDVTFSPYNDPGIDLAIMSLCDHVVVSRGTFGWWGAWLSNGTVVYSNDSPMNGSKLSKGFNNDDYYPPHWTSL